MMRSVFSTTAAICLALLTSGCGRSPQVNFYTLTPGATTQAPAPSPALPSPAFQGASSAKILPVVAVGPITLPDVVDRPQLVVQAGPNQVKILETKRWAEPLKSGIPRFMAREIGRQLASRRVFSYLEMTGAAADYRVLVDFSRFESTPGDAVTVEADWSVRHLGKTVKTGHSQVRQQIQGDGYDAVVAAYGAALSALSAEVASGLQTLKP
jgi:uncharacterized lipoprotein YmbA